MPDIFEHCPDFDWGEMGFISNPIDSRSEMRTPHCLSAALDHPDTRYLLYAGQHIMINPGCNGCFHDTQAIEAMMPDYKSAILLGWWEDIPTIAIPAMAADLDLENLSRGWQAFDMRGLLRHSGLPADQISAAAAGYSLLAWQSKTQFCGRCGAPTLSALGGLRRDCQICDLKVFPRLDPVVIMLIIRDGYCLMGRGPQFPRDWFSCLAGFIEPGETVEQAVRRETREESGINVGKVNYFSSQPWPFPHSLMIGAYGEGLSSDICFDGIEIEDCRWFSKSEVCQMLDGKHTHGFRVPTKGSISYLLINHWARN